MIAVDTNIVVRLLVNDDAAQATRARALFARSEPIFVSPTVLLETEWVLRAAYRYKPNQIAGFLRALLGLPGLQTSEPEHVARALSAYEQGRDWADALHVALSHDADVFYTFDTALTRKASQGIAGSQVQAP